MSEKSFPCTPVSMPKPNPMILYTRTTHHGCSTTCHEFRGIGSHLLPHPLITTAVTPTINLSFYTPIYNTTTDDDLSQGSSDASTYGPLPNNPHKIPTKLDIIPLPMPKIQGDECNTARSALQPNTYTVNGHLFRRYRLSRNNISKHKSTDNTRPATYHISRQSDGTIYQLHTPK